MIVSAATLEQSQELLDPGDVTVDDEYSGWFMGAEIDGDEIVVSLIVSHSRGDTSLDIRVLPTTDVEIHY